MPRTFETDSISLTRPLLAKVLVTQIELLLHLVEYRPREGDAARLGKRFEARRNIHAIAKQVIAFDHHGFSVPRLNVQARTHEIPSGAS